MCIPDVTGIVTFSDAASGFAYITVGNRAIFVPASGCLEKPGRLKPGMKVQCDLLQYRDGVALMNVRIHRGSSAHFVADPIALS